MKSASITTIHQCLDEWVARDIVPNVASVILHDGEVVDEYCTGLQSHESQIPLNSDSIFRIFSNTKLITAVAAMTLYEQGSFDFDDELVRYIPEFSDLVVLEPGAQTISSVEPLKVQPTIRHVMSHTVGFSYGIFNESIIDPVYTEKRVLHPRNSLAEMTSILATVPLANQPGARFRYGVAYDVLGRLIEIWSGLSFGEYLKRTIFSPLGMSDTGFCVPPEHASRLCNLYVGVDEHDPIKPGLKSTPNLMGNYLKPRTLESGGGGLVSTMRDYTKFIQMLMGQGLYDGIQLIQPETLTLMYANQLPPAKRIELPRWYMPDTVYGIGFAIKLRPARGEPKSAEGEVHWGGLAGTHSWIAPKNNLGAILFTQRMGGFWHPFYHEHKQLVYAGWGGQ